MRKAEERELLSGVAQVQSRHFEGKVVTQAQNNKEIASEWRELQKRARAHRLCHGRWNSRARRSHHGGECTE